MMINIIRDVNGEKRKLVVSQVNDNNSFNYLFIRLVNRDYSSVYRKDYHLSGI
jgi:hypothetical protein